VVERNRANLDRTARALVDAANKGGGEDNITVIVFELGDDGAEEAPRLAPAAEVTPDDDERTLTELDAVPAIDDTMPVSRDQLEALAGPGNGHEPRRRRKAPWAVIAVVAATALVVFGALAVWTLSRSYFVGVQPDGHVAVYQGFPWNVVGGVRLYRMRYESPVLAGQLSQPERRTLFDHDLRTYDRALDAVKQYEAQVVP
jgi:protein phosphatase